MIQKMILLGISGALGTIARYSVAGAVQRIAGEGFPWGTVAVNVAGCFLAGLLWSVYGGRLNLDAGTRMIVFIGFMGAFTTFSTFMLETSHLASQAAWFSALGNLLLQNTIGFGFIFLGLGLGRMVQ